MMKFRFDLFRNKFDGKIDFRMNSQQESKLLAFAWKINLTVFFENKFHLRPWNVFQSLIDFNEENFHDQLSIPRNFQKPYRNKTLTPYGAFLSFPSSSRQDGNTFNFPQSEIDRSSGNFFETRARSAN